MGDGSGDFPTTETAILHFANVQTSPTLDVRLTFGSWVHGAASAGDPAADFIAQVIPFRAGVAIPLEKERILWQR
jgi:hypothetical protein